MGSGFAKKKKQSKMMQEQLAKFQGDMQNIEAAGSAGNGLVTITLSGDHKMKQISIKPDCVDPEDVDGLQDLIKAAYQDALSKLEDANASKMQGLGGLGGFPF